MESVRNQLRKPFSSTWISVSVVLLLLLAFISYAIVYRTSGPSARTSQTTRPFTEMPGFETHPSFSPDGRTVAFTWGDSVDSDIYVQRADSHKPVLLVHTNLREFRPVWSPGGDEVAFLRKLSDNRYAICSTKLVGGSERKWAEIEDTTGATGATPRLDWSPDGKFFLVSETNPADSPPALVRIAAQGGTKQRLTNPPAGTNGDTSAVFSPDGESIAFRRGITAGVEDIYVMPSDGGVPRRLTNDGSGTRGHAWCPDGRSIIFASNRSGSRPTMWKIAASGGEPVRVTEADIAAYFPAVSLRGNRLAFESYVHDVNVWEARGGHWRRVIESRMLDSGAQYSPDGTRIVFRSNRSGFDEIWICNRDGSDVRVLTDLHGPVTGTPRWSSDGRYITFDSRPHGNADVFIVPVEGGPARRFTSASSNEVAPSWSHDGRFIYFGSNRTGSWQIWKQAVAGDSAPVQITRSGGFTGFESPDGMYLYYADDPRHPKLRRVSVQGGSEEVLLDSLGNGMWGNWALGPDGVFYIALQGSQASIRLFDWKRREIRYVMPMERMPAVGDSGLSVSPDGESILISQMDASGSDIHLIEDFR
jgi:Tol biopolymer transport system component